MNEGTAMHARHRVLRLASATAAALMSGGVAWAATSVATPSAARVHSSVETTTSSVETTSTESPTTDTTSSTEAETTTTVADTTTTVAETPTTVETATTLPAAPTGPQACKPGWGYGDTNHCHSGPPGLGTSKHDRSTHGHPRH